MTFRGWPKIGGEVGKYANKAKAWIQETGEVVQDVIDDIGDDVTGILGNIEDCAADLDQIRLAIMNRGIAYHNNLFRLMIDNLFLFRLLIDEIRRRVGLDLEGEPHPKIYFLDKEHPTDVSLATEVNIDSWEFPEGRYPCMFIHGMGHGQSIEKAHKVFMEFQSEVPVFGHDNYKSHDMYLVSYDTDLTDDMKNKIHDAFKDITGIEPEDVLTSLYPAVFWRELEERAKKTGDYIVSFLRKLNKFNENIDKRGFVITHSLGCFTFAYAAQKLLEENIGYDMLDKWLCIAPAIPSNGFSEDGIFKIAPCIAGLADGPKYGTSVWYSRLDVILNVAYTAATGEVAMGSFGPSENNVFLTKMDVTQKIREDHEIEAYSEKLKTDFREIFRI